MLFTIAWRNIWRNRMRSWVVIGAIALGIWGVLFMIAFSLGTSTSYIQNAVENELSHVQVHDPRFRDQYEIGYQIPDAQKLLDSVRQNPEVLATGLRTIANGMLTSGHGARGIRITGVDPENEAELTHLNEKMTEGQYLSEDQKNPIVISSKLAEKLQVKVKSKVVLTFQNETGEITSAAFRIQGLFKTNNSKMDEAGIFVLRKDLNRLLGKENMAHEMAILLHDEKAATPFAQALAKGKPGLEILSYEALSPEITLLKTQIQITSTILIVMLALVFGIINTMLMAVLERVRELGMLMAIGMNKLRVFGMIMMETFLLSLIAAPLGMLLGFMTVKWLGKTGINLGAWSSAMQQYGISDIIYPYMEGFLYRQLATAVVATALIASLYPAWKAIRLQPVEAIRKI